MFYNKIIQNVLSKKLFNQRLVLVIFLFMSCIFSTVAQVGPVNNTNMMTNSAILDMMDRTNVNRVIDGSQDPIDGSPYLKDDFETGEITLVDSTVFPDILLRYNIYNDQIEFQDEGKNYVIGTKILVKNITLGEDIFVVDLLETVNGERQGFLTLLADGEVKLLCKYNMELTDRVPSKALQDPQPRKFVRKQDIYFVKVGLQRINEIGSVKKLIIYLENHQDELKTFSKKEKILSNNPEELAKLITYFNSL